MPTDHNWLQSYIEYSMAQCESPAPYHQWVALWVLSCCAQRRISIPLHDSSTFPNLYVTLVGPSARVQKSTVGEIGVELLYHLNDLCMMQDRVTRAYLHAYLAEASGRGGDTCVAIFAPEMRTALNEMTLMEGIMEILTRAHDCPRRLEYRLRHGGVQSARNVWLAMLCCSTPQWLTTGLARDEVGGGFAGRMILVYGDMPHRRMQYNPRMQERMRNLRPALLERMLVIEQMRGDMTLTQGAATIWDDLRLQLDATTREKDMRVQPFLDRMHSHTLKVAALLSVSRRDSMIINEKDMVDAIDLLHDVEEHVMQSLASVSVSRPNTLGDAVLASIRERGGFATRSDVVKMMYNKRLAMSKIETDQIMELLVDVGRIIPSMRQANPGTKAALVYYLAESAPENLQQQMEILRQRRESGEQVN